MRRQDIRLLAMARSGDVQARCEVGRRYLLGADGFPRHLASGIEHLSHPSVASLPQAAQIVAECMTLDEIVQARMMGALQRAADAGIAVAQAKLGAWWFARHAAAGAGPALLQAAAAQGLAAAQSALDEWRRVPAGAGVGASLVAALRPLARQGLLDAGAVSLAAAQEALQLRDLPALGAALSAALALCETMPEELPELVVRAVEAAEATGTALVSLAAAAVEPILESRATAGDRDAAYALGRALCGIDLGSVPAGAIAEGQNMRKGAALLLRAADAGCDEAWLHLYRIHSDNRLSVANPQMARFFLEKAALRGMAEAQRRLGALVLRTASTLQESEQALGWLHQAAQQGDDHARLLLRSLVLPLEGEDEEADAAIAAVARTDPWLAARLRISREFGLTKLEALCFEPVSGLRPWGLVVGKNPFISQIRLSAPRAIPALTAQSLEHLRSVAEFFSRAGADASRYEGDLRRRSLNQRRLFAKLGLDEAMFFAVASSVALDSFRLGTKWAFRVREPLKMALAE
jgi:TPR repeat protein